MDNRNVILEKMQELSKLQKIASNKMIMVNDKRNVLLGRMFLLILGE